MLFIKIDLMVFGLFCQIYQHLKMEKTSLSKNGLFDFDKNITVY